MRGKIASLSIIVMLCIAVPAMSSVVSLPKTGQTTCYLGSGEIDCAGTGQDGEEERGASWPSPRFTIQYCDESGPCSKQDQDCDAIGGNNLITDNLTGLMWMGGPIYWKPYGSTKEVTWTEALDDAQGRTVCGQSGWRLPNIVELLSISCYGKKEDCPDRTVPLGFYSWSSTTHAGYPAKAWLAYNSGYDVGIGGYGEKTATQKATLVRGSGGGRIALPSTGQTTSYHGGDDGALKMGAAWPNPRFTDLGDFTFRDELTGLRWYKYPTGGWWGSVLDQVKSKNASTYLCSDRWIVPNIIELRSLFDFGRSNPALPEGHLFELPYEYGWHYIWSSTTHADSGSTGSAFTMRRWDAYQATTPKGNQDGHYGFLMIDSGSPLCVYRLSVTVLGIGTGKVTSSYGGIDCNSSGVTKCWALFGKDAQVTLTAVPDAGSTFTGWSGGGCTGTGPCTVTVTGDVTVTAYFGGTPTLTVAKTGSGGGVVTSVPAGINCGQDCSEDYNSGTIVTLYATANADSIFAGWSGGGCSGTGSCSVTVNSNMTVTARFELLRTLTVTKSGDGYGTVTSTPAGIDCGITCAKEYGEGTQVTLIAAASKGSVFAGWSGGGCSGTGSCTVALTGNVTVTAQFNMDKRLVVGRTGSGSGTVTSVPPGIDCGGDCDEYYTSGTQVTLTAQAGPGCIFVGWVEGCTGTGPCSVVMDTDRSVKARFEPYRTLTVTRAGKGSGTVTSAPPGISCGTDCTEAYVQGTSIALTATASPDSVFSHWSGGCTGSKGCEVTLDADTTVTAHFVPLRTLTVTRNGAGTGRVASNPAGINCGTECAFDYVDGVEVVLTATADAGSVFGAWSGCDTTSGSQCRVTMVIDKFVYATFNAAKILTVTKEGTGLGVVTSAPPGISCGDDCAEGYNEGTVVTLAAAASPGSIFTGWSGGSCSGTGACEVTMSVDTTVTAVFTARRTVTVSKSGSGNGMVTSSPEGISCGEDCSEAFNHGTVVTLSAVPDAASSFTGWSGGGCSGTGSCSVTATADVTVTATFMLLADPLDTWHWRDSGEINTLWALAYGNGTFAAVGEYGIIVASPDGSAWSPVDVPTAENLNNVAYLNGLFVAVGSNGAILTSPDGATWSPRASSAGIAVASNLFGIAYGNGIYLSVGKAGATAASSDGHTWTSRTIPGAPDLYGVAFGGGIFAAVGKNGVIRTSPDGTSWMVRSSGTTDTIWYVTYGKGIFVAVGGTNTVLTSANGETWEKRSIDGAAGLWGVVYANDTFVAVGYGGSIYTSADGVSWKGRTSGVVLSLLNAGYGRDTFVIVGEEGTILQSDPLAPPSHYALSVGRKGTGAGTVTSIPPGISCGTDCSEPFARDTVVTLYAEAAPGSTFAGWSGACSGTGTCTVTMNEDRFVTAAFAVPEHVLTVVRSGAGAGTVTSSPAGISCGEDCSQSYPQGSSVTLTASASAGSSFAGWSGGGCSGTGTCVVSVNAATTVTADFTLLPCTYKLTPASKAFTANGGTVTVTVVGTGQAVCAAPGVIAPGWVTTTQSAWVKNRGTVKITVLKNPSSLPKSDTVTIGGVPFAVTQAGAPCAITRFIPTSQSFGKAPGSGSFAVEVAPQDCAWTTSVSAAAMPWLHITSGAGTGNGTVQYGIDENLGKVSRTGTITVTLTQNAKKKAFTVRQGNK